MTNPQSVRGSLPGGGWLRTLIAEAGGWISVERFMAEAGFHPEFGYYTAGVRTVGRDGDFSTSATLHPALGQALAGWASARRPEVRRWTGWGGRRWHVIELGAGGGQLAESFLRSLGPWRRRGLRLHLVEVSPRLRAEQAARLRPWSRRVRWHEGVGSALAAADEGRALVFSNEFVDAFPCQQWERRAGRWREVGVTWPEGAGGPGEELRDRPLPSVTDATAFDQACYPDPPDGQRVEAHLAYRDWLRRELRPGWRAGRLLTIDYGAELPALYHRRPGGTRRAYFHHLRQEGAEFYARPGQQDLTADVNFSDLRRWGRDLGMAEGEPALQSQGEFLRRWLPPRDAVAAPDPRLAFLLDRDGAGGAFQVLEQRPARPACD